MLTAIEETNGLGVHSVFTCPDCGGNMWRIQDGELIRYRCYTGHAYTESQLLTNQTENIERTLWIALRMMEERKKLLENIPAQGAE